MTFHRSTTGILPCDSCTQSGFRPWNHCLDRNQAFDGLITLDRPNARNLPGDVRIDPR